MQPVIRIATRKSALALWQANWVAKKLNQFGCDSKIVAISTKGDSDLSQSLAKIGGKGLFIKELEVAMIENHADIAVHSMKDLPSQLPDQLIISTCLKRDNPLDCLIIKRSDHHAGLANLLHHFEADQRKINRSFLIKLANNFRLGTSSLRRSSQLLKSNPNLKIVPMRGNLNTRMEKLENGTCDGLVLARAGVNRLFLSSNSKQSEQFRQKYFVLNFSKKTMIPAIGQGVVAIECTKNSPYIAMLKKINHQKSAITTLAERTINEKLGGSCTSTLCAYAKLKNNTITIFARVLSEDGSECLEVKKSAPIKQARALAEEIANQLVSMGAKQYL